MVMTTWHENESLRDAAFFWWNNTSFENYPSRRLAVLLVGEAPARKAELEKIIEEFHSGTSASNGG